MHAPVTRPTTAAPATWAGEMRATLGLAAPLVAANLLQMGVYAVDVIFVARLGTVEFAAATLGVRPENLYPADGGAFAGTVELFERLGPLSFAHLGTFGDHPAVVAQLPGDRAITLGERLRFAVAPEAAHLFDSDGRAYPRPASALDAAAE